jgi:hypothetical protein
MQVSACYPAVPSFANSISIVSIAEPFLMETRIVLPYCQGNRSKNFAAEFLATESVEMAI